MTVQQNPEISIETGTEKMNIDHNPTKNTSGKKWGFRAMVLTGVSCLVLMSVLISGHGSNMNGPSQSDRGLLSFVPEEPVENRYVNCI